MDEIRLVREALDKIANDDENIDMLEQAMNNYCCTWDKCLGFKKAIMYTVHDQYTNHAHEQSPNNIKELLQLLS